MLKHIDAEREPVVIVYENDWAIAVILAQVHDDVCLPVKFISRTLKPNELNYNIVEKEILALLRALNECFTMLAGRTVRVLTRHTTLAWLFRSKGLQGRLSHWAAVLSPWRLEICRSVKGEEEILGTLATSITPREFVDAVLEEISPRKRPPRTAVIPVPSVAPDEERHGSDNAKREGGAFSAVVWKLLGWEVARAASRYATGLTVNEAEYRGLLLGCSLLQQLEVSRLVVCRDSNLVIRQMREEMDCKSPGLKLLRQQAKNVLETWPRRELFHVRRDWNASEHMLAGPSASAPGRAGYHRSGRDPKLEEAEPVGRSHTPQHGPSYDVWSRTADDTVAGRTDQGRNVADDHTGGLIPRACSPTENAGSPPRAGGATPPTISRPDGSGRRTLDR
ncbi:unnamed protein product [Phytophthora fragariaefolia]|uniref:Unnamed protein product n=1 Tax=Phytophthora fragariaefolia TaxID=1490495 RepID=A0A9W7CVF2_9STRA|nr:unnamed protein product [Phytophthora fragariaefolia]